MPALIDRHQRHFFYQHGYILFDRVFSQESLNIKMAEGGIKGAPWYCKSHFSRFFDKGILAQVVCGLWNVDSCDVICELALMRCISPKEKDQVFQGHETVSHLLENPHVLGTVWLCLRAEEENHGENCAYWPQAAGQVCCLSPQHFPRNNSHIRGKYLAWVIAKEGWAQGIQDEQLLKNAKMSALRLRRSTIL